MYDKNRVEVLNYLSGTGGIAFVEFREIGSAKVKILAYQTFIKRYGVENGTEKKDYPRTN